jgi:hypothetical protein
MRLDTVVVLEPDSGVDVDDDRPDVIDSRVRVHDVRDRGRQRVLTALGRHGAAPGPDFEHATNMESIRKNAAGAALHDKTEQPAARPVENSC